MIIKFDLFTIILGISALFISGMAAFFSVTGIGMLFSGSFIAVCMMASSLEVGKLVTASFLYRYWNTINWLQKSYMTIATIILIGITSMGIFGFLSNSYMGATVEFEGMTTKLQVYKDQLNTLEEDKEFLKQELEQSVNALPDNYITVKRKLRNEYNPLIQDKSIQISELKNKVGQLEIEMVDTGIDVGPLLYIAEAFDTDIDTAVKWIMLVLIFVFDPLAVILVIGFNIVLLDKKDIITEEDKDYKVYMPPVPTVYTSDNEISEEEYETHDKGTNEHLDTIEELQPEPVVVEEPVIETPLERGTSRNPSTDGGQSMPSEYPPGRK